MRKNKAIAIILAVVVLLAGLSVYGVNVLNATTSKGDKSITLGLDLIDERKAKLTEYGVLCRMDVGMRNSQEEEEFE